MNDFVLYSIFFVTGVLIGFVFWKWLNTSKQQQFQRISIENEQLSTQLAKLQTELERLRYEKEDLVREYAKIESEYGFLKERTMQQKEEVINLQKQFSLHFENLAQRILEEKSEKFAHQNKNALENILQPLNEKIRSFEEKVNQSHTDSLVTHASLKEQLVYLTSLNKKMNEETQNLTKALKAETKMQGNWGEVILERILEKSGLEKNREYTVQEHFVDAEGRRLQPDIVIYLPENKRIIIDAKVSLTAYERFVNAADKEERDHALKQHLLSLKQHLNVLHGKQYYDILDGDSPEFVLLFIPIETAFTTAIDKEPLLYQNAFDKKIVMVTPSTLLAALKTINSLWQNKKQHENAVEIARQAGNLYDKLAGFVEDLNSIGIQLNKTQNEFDKAKNKLYEGKGNLISSAQRLKLLGIKSKKEL